MGDPLIRKIIVLGLLMLLLLCAGQALGIVVPDPAEVLGGQAVLYMEDYVYSSDWTCDGYTFASPRDWDGFLRKYTLLSRASGFSVEHTVEDGMDAWLLKDGKTRRGMLVPNFRGSLLLLVDQNAMLSTLPAATPVPTATPAPVVQPTPAVQPKPTDSTISEDGFWIEDFVMQDCPQCVGGRCPLCNGSGRKIRAGGSWDDGVFCTEFCTNCFGTGMIEVEQMVWVPFE